MEPKIYFAAPLFTEAEQDFNRKVVDKIREACPGLTVSLPQENESINNKENHASSQDIFRADYKELKDSDLLIAVIDNEDIGVAVEVGIAYEMGLTIIGLSTDIRQKGGDNPETVEAIQFVGENPIKYLNLMQTGAIKDVGFITESSDELVSVIKRWYESREDYLEEEE